jgi:thioredoxin reductase
MQYDVIIVGGSYAGLSAGLALGRARKRALVIDAGQRRNRFAHESHGFLGQDGREPGEIVAAARAEVAAYPTVSFFEGVVTRAERDGEGFAVTLEDGTTRVAKRLILATGVEDVLPDLPGLREGWGTAVLHCPYCHGYEVAERRLGVLAFMPEAMHQAELISEWGPTTFLTNEIVTLAAHERETLAARGVAVVDGTVAEIVNADAGIAGVRMRDGRTIALDALFIGVPWRLANPLAEQLGCAIDDSPFGPAIRVDGTGETNAPGVFAAGDAAMMMKNIPGSVASGYLAGVAAHRSLLMARR